VAEVLRTLQKEAPQVPSEVMEYEIRGALEDFDELFESMNLEPFAAASIGQVHRARLRDGRPVAVKIQYPLIDEIVKADLKNLRTLLKALFGLISDVDFEPIWGEVRDRLLEELDYTHEAANIRRMVELHAEVPEIIIPGVVEEASARNVLTMELVEGIEPTEACSAEHDDELRSRWGAVLLEFQLRGLFEHRFLHADPNLSNFAFLEDGRVIVYDFGCVKQIPETLAVGYAQLALAALEGRSDDIPEVLQDLGVHREGGAALPASLTGPYVEVFAPIFREQPPYTFGEDRDLYERLIELGLTNWSQARDIRFPKDVVFVDRAMSGHFGNLIRLQATGPWRDLLLKHARAV
jgi:predicted unusual protein kinase regulating ubiquinone biosynthesis (AarF/ABC1/UbiB family)